jgi:uncharacterized protein YndB with AHSA1/START domain
VKPEKLVYLHDAGKDNDPQEFQAFITFEAIGQQTKVTLRSVFKTKEARDFVVKEFGALEGAKQHLGNLERYLQNLT